MILVALRSSSQNLVSHHLQENHLKLLIEKAHIWALSKFWLYQEFLGL